MKNVMNFEGGFDAVISFDPEIEMFRGEFVGLNGGADFYAADLAGLRREGERSLAEFLAVCRERNLPVRRKEGRFALRLKPETYRAVVLSARSDGMSINAWIEKTLAEAVTS